MVLRRIIFTFLVVTLTIIGLIHKGKTNQKYFFFKVTIQSKTKQIVYFLFWYIFFLNLKLIQN